MTTPYSKINTPLPEYELSVEGFKGSSDISGNVLKVEPSSQASVSQSGPDIGHSLSVFETALTNLLESVGNFSPSIELANSVIDADKSLDEAIDELVVQQQACDKIESLQQESDELNQQLNKILVELSNCRRSLSSLPVLFSGESDGTGSSKESNDTNFSLTAGNLLEYANKITKFTRAPPGYNPEMPEYANFPWPNEDELRKGVLAMNTLRDHGSNSEEHNSKNSTQATQATQNMANSTTNTVQQHNKTISQNSNEILSKMSRRRSSAVSYGERPNVAPLAPPGKAILDLDLFDPDEEDED